MCSWNQQFHTKHAGASQVTFRIILGWTVPISTKNTIRRCLHPTVAIENIRSQSFKTGGPRGHFWSLKWPANWKPKKHLAPSSWTGSWRWLRFGESNASRDKLERLNRDWRIGPFHVVSWCFVPEILEFSGREMIIQVKYVKVFTERFEFVNMSIFRPLFPFYNVFNCSWTSWHNVQGRGFPQATIVPSPFKAAKASPAGRSGMIPNMSY